MNPVTFPVRLTEMCLYVSEDEHPHLPPQLRPASADERHPDQLSESLAGAYLAAAVNICSGRGLANGMVASVGTVH